MAIANLVGGVFPDFAEQQCIRLFGKYGLLDLGQEVVGKLVSDVQTPAMAPARSHLRITPSLPRSRSRTSSELSLMAGMLPTPHQQSYEPSSWKVNASRHGESSLCQAPTPG